jgi:hypothetical protein
MLRRSGPPGAGSRCRKRASLHLFGCVVSLDHHQVAAGLNVGGAVRDRQISPRRLYDAKAAGAAVERDRAADNSGYAEQQARHIAGLDGHAILMLLKG